ncbi:MAG: hypothetical protein ACRD04_08445 [Terriglobales bacterium]
MRAGSAAAARQAGPQEVAKAVSASSTGAAASAMAPLLLMPGTAARSP